MSRPFAGNWACTGVRKLIQQGATAEQIAEYLASQEKFLAAIQDGIDNNRPNVPGGDGAEIAVSNLSEALVETGF